MLLVIFGAGASYDSVTHRPPPAANFLAATNSTRVQHLGSHEEFRPPLASQLFDDRPLFVRVMQNYAACKPLVNLLRGDVRVEQQLAKFEEEAKTFPVRRRQLAAIKYYLHEVMWSCQNEWQNEHKGITNYLTFLDAIDRWRYENEERVCIVTFNYDTMVEASMLELWGWNFADLNAYTSQPNYKLIKLHGSVDWGLELRGVRGYGSTAEIIDGAIVGLEVSDLWEKVTHNMKNQNGRVDFPALAIPVEKKSEFACPPDHLSALADAIPHVTTIITIGWRATEQHFLRMLKAPLTGLQGNVDLMVVSGDLGGVTETNTNLGLVNPPSGRRYVTVDSGFSGLIRNVGALERFLY